MALEANTSLALVGAGLHNTLIALAALDADPHARLVLLERDERACGNHTWSFHEGDVPASLRGLMDRLPAHRWPGYQVAFPDRNVEVGLGYVSLASTDLASVLESRIASAPNARLLTGVEVVAADEAGVSLRDGQRIQADLVIDARGPGTETTDRCGYQKFVGLELGLDRPHGLDRPILMDATVEQIDGYRFFYALPLGPTRILLEDTVFSTSADLDVPTLRERVLSEAGARGWSGAQVLRQEQGVLPMPWSGEGPVLQERGPFHAGFAGGFFHPATGYSAPQAMRVATLVADQLRNPGGLFSSPAYISFVQEHRRQTRFARFLNRLLFTGVSPATRWTIFSRFYGHPLDVITRFYACELKRSDRARMLVGRPPRGFSLRSALLGSAMQ